MLAGCGTRSVQCLESDGSAHGLGANIFQRSTPSAAMSSVLVSTLPLFIAMWKFLPRTPRRRDKVHIDNMFRCAVSANKRHKCEVIPRRSRVRLGRIFNLPCRSCQMYFAKRIFRHTRTNTIVDGSSLFRKKDGWLICLRHYTVPMITLVFNIYKRIIYSQMTNAASHFTRDLVEELRLNQK